MAGTAVTLKKRFSVSTSDGTERGPLMADDQGVFVTAKRRWFGKSHPGHRYNVVVWSEVAGASLGQPQASQVGGSTINANHSLLTLRTASNVHTWDLPIPQSRVTSLLGPWLAKVPGGTS